MLRPFLLSVERSGLPITVELVIVASLLGAVAVFLLVKLLTTLTWVSTIAAVAVAAVPYLVVRIVESRRVRQFEEQFPQAIDLIASSLRAGHAFTTGVMMAADEVQDPLGAEFRLLYDHQNYGMPFPDALKAFARRVPLLDARFFVTAVLTQREAGGNLAEVLDNLSSVIRERSRVKRQVRVASAHGRITGWILSAMPPILAGVMTIVAPEHMRSFVSDPLGVRMIIAALVSAGDRDARHSAHCQRGVLGEHHEHGICPTGHRRFYLRRPGRRVSCVVDARQNRAWSSTPSTGFLCLTSDGTHDPGRGARYAGAVMRRSNSRKLARRSKHGSSDGWSRQAGRIPRRPATSRWRSLPFL